MSRRARALAFLCAAALCAALAAAIAGGYRSSVSDQFGELRPVLVASKALAAHEEISARVAARSLEVRRVPERFAPPNALSVPGEVVGKEPLLAIAPGAYVTAAELRLPQQERRGGARGSLPARLSPVEIQVTAAGPLAATASDGQTEVDVVVTTEPGPGGDGRTYVAATAVPLLGLAQSAGSSSDGALPGGEALSHTATLGLTREQALELIDAESFARQIRLIPAA